MRTRFYEIKLDKPSCISYTCVASTHEPKTEELYKYLYRMFRDKPEDIKGFAVRKITKKEACDRYNVGLFGYHLIDDVGFDSHEL
jgi:hypothetical protein